MKVVRWPEESMSENKGIEALRKWREQGGVAERLDPVEKARRNPTSLRAAITAMCWQCQCGDADPGVKWRIGNCQIETCALWKLRPWQTQHGKAMPEALKHD